jgi:hypothetical protein
MGAVVAVRRVDGEPVLLVLKLLEELQTALPANAGSRQILGAGQVRSRFLRAREGQKLSERGTLPHHHQAHARVACARRNRNCAEDHCRQTDARRLFGSFAEADGVPAGDVAELVRDDGLKFVRIVGSQN